jgi:hypothetical protein
MRLLSLMSIVLLGGSCAAHAGEQSVPGKVAPDTTEYDKAVARVWGSITSTDHVVRWCMKNASKSKKPVEAAYREWKTKFAPLISEIDVRIDRVMNSSGSYTAKELAARKADVLKRGADRYAAGIASEPQEEVKHECELLPEYFTTKSFDLEARFAPELKLIRAQPLEKSPSTPAPPRS